MSSETKITSDEICDVMKVRDIIGIRYFTIEELRRKNKLDEQTQR